MIRYDDIKDKELWYLSSYPHNVTNDDGKWERKYYIGNDKPKKYVTITEDNINYVTNVVFSGVFTSVIKNIDEVFLTKNELLDYLKINMLDKANNIIRIYNELIVNGEVDVLDNVINDICYK